MALTVVPELNGDQFSFALPEGALAWDPGASGLQLGFYEGAAWTWTFGRAEKRMDKEPAFVVMFEVEGMTGSIFMNWLNGSEKDAARVGKIQQFVRAVWRGPNGEVPTKQQVYGLLQKMRDAHPKKILNPKVLEKFLNDHGQKTVNMWYCPQKVDGRDTWNDAEFLLPEDIEKYKTGKLQFNPRFRDPIPAASTAATAAEVGPLAGAGAFGGGQAQAFGGGQAFGGAAAGQLAQTQPAAQQAEPAPATQPAPTTQPAGDGGGADFFAAFGNPG